MRRPYLRRDGANERQDMNGTVSTSGANDMPTRGYGDCVGRILQREAFCNGVTRAACSCRCWKIGVCFPWPCFERAINPGDPELHMPRVLMLHGCIVLRSRPNEGSRGLLSVSCPPVGKTSGLMVAERAGVIPLVMATTPKRTDKNSVTIALLAR